MLTINDQEMNSWVQTWLRNVGVSQIGLGLRRNLYLPSEAWAGMNLKEFMSQSYWAIKTTIWLLLVFTPEFWQEPTSLSL